MANLKSAIKRARTTERKRIQNERKKSTMKSMVKKVENAIQTEDVELAKSTYGQATREIDKAIQKGIIHRNNGNRKKKRLAQKIAHL